MLLPPAVVALLGDLSFLARQPFATDTSICRNRFTTCSGVCFFLRAIMRSLNHSLYQTNWFKKRRALHVQRQDAKLLRHSLHCNIVRTSHYPKSRHFLDCCDEIGLLVLEEIPGWQHIGPEPWKQIAIDNGPHDKARLEPSIDYSMGRPY